MPARRPKTPQYLSSAEGLSMLEFIQRVFVHVGDVTEFLSNDVYYELYHKHVGSRSYLEDKFPDLHIITLNCSVIRSGHSGYCSDPDDEDYISDPYESIIYIALPDGLVGDIADISADQLLSHEHSQCWCGGQSENWSVVSIEY
jgi:hypothetical protein